MWLTYEQQKKYYDNWEFHLIKSGFGREPENKKERNLYGNVIFHPGQLDRILHINEMGFSFDGAKNGIGGRIPCYYSNPLIAEAGTACEKSSLKVSILFGANYNCQPIPPLIVFPTTAKAPKLELKLLQTLHQVCGKFGYEEERWFNPVIGK